MEWDGSTWTKVSTLPYYFHAGFVLVYNDEIHILGGAYSSNANNSYKLHYKWDGTSWTSVSTLPYTFYYGSAVIYNDEIHILGGNDGVTSHYKWDGSTWIKVSTLPYNFCKGGAVVYNDEIHILGSYSSGYQKYHYNLNIEYLISDNYLPSGANIYFYNDYFLSSAITAKTNCSIQSDGSFLVDSDGLVEFITNNLYYIENDIINFTANF